MVVIDRLTGKKEAEFLTQDSSSVRKFIERLGKVYYSGKVVRLDSEKDCVFAETNREVQKELEEFFAREED
jgi:hypothetical protein